MDIGVLRDAVSPMDASLSRDTGHSPDVFLQDDQGVEADAMVPASRAVLTDPGDELALLFVGNSYIGSNNLPNLVCGLARATERWDTVVCERVTAGGYRLTQHNADAAANRRLGALLDPENADRPDWDAVILQEQSQIPGFPEGNADLLAFLNAVVELDQRIAAVGAETALLMTWGRRDGDGRNLELYPDYSVMQTRLEDGYQRAANEASTAERRVHILPVGRAWRQTYERSPEDDFRELYSNDGSHPAYPGSYLAGVTILSRLTGVEPAAFLPVGDGPAEDLAQRLRQDVAETLAEDP